MNDPRVSRPRGEKVARVLAFYLPQFHPIPENDEWWGKGFTEWTNVTKAVPLFEGHEQPRLPADLGYYDLRVPEVRQAQAEMAASHGIEAFCYWHYWFGEGKRLLERPFAEVLASGQPDFPFCLAWANASWSGIWHGAPDKILIEQRYPGVQDYREHFREVLPALQDDRYVRIDGKPLFLVYRPGQLPDANEFTDCWRELALAEGFSGLYLACVAPYSWNPEAAGFDAVISDPPGDLTSQLTAEFPAAPGSKWPFNRDRAEGPEIYRYEDIVKLASDYYPEHDRFFPCIVPNWDNTPRSGRDGVVFAGCTTGWFRELVSRALSKVAHRPVEQRVVFLKSWNEWAEGNYLEPDQANHLSNLKALRDLVWPDRLSET